MKRVILAATLVSVTGLGWGVVSQMAAPATTPRKPRFASEQAWIVSEIVRVIESDVSAAAAAASSAPREIVVKTVPATPLELLNAATLEATVDGHALPSIVLKEHVWRPANYVGIAGARLGPACAGHRVARRPETAPSAAAPPPAQPSPLSALIEPRLETLLAQETSISAAMRADPCDPGPFEDAALLVAILALRDTASDYTDVRPLLGRTTAHLAVASALSPDDRAPGASARMALVIVDALAGREDLAIGALDHWPDPAHTEAFGQWNTALRLRITGDWRTAPPDTASLLVRLEYARAVRERLGPSQFLDYLDGQSTAEADWHRIALHVGWTGASIETRHRFVERGLQRELDEGTAVWRHFHDGDPSPPVVLAALNDEGPSAYRAVDWPTWADALQRHLCAQLLASERYLRSLGLNQEARDWVLENRERFGHLDRFPFVLVRAADDAASYRAAAREAIHLQNTRPELVTPRLALLVRKKPTYLDKPDPYPSDVAWFTPHVPTGTAFELLYRSLAPGCARPVPLAQVARWVAMAPSDTWVVQSQVWLNGPGIPTFADVERAVGRLAAYDTRPSLHMLEHLKATSDQYDALARRLCTLDVEKCPELGWRLLAAGRPAEAAEVYERYAAHARDHVGVSNAVGWLVKYYWDTGRRERATALAEEAGETWSAAGLEIQGTVLERQGRTDEARATFEHIRDRYDSGGAALAGYYLRLARQTGESQYVARAAAAVPELFTNGLEHADLAWLPAPPTDGVVFTRFSRVAERAGLKPTDVLVALDGYRIRSTGQYHVVARGSFEPTMHFIVWRDGRNQRVDAHVPQRLMGVGMDTHPSALRSPS